MSDVPAAPQGRASREVEADATAAKAAVDAGAGADAPTPAQPSAQATAEPLAPALDEAEQIERKTPRQRSGGLVIGTAAAVLLLVVAALATTPFWAPAIIRLLPWGQTETAAKPAAPPATTAPTAAPATPTPKPVAVVPDPELAALRTQAAQNAAAMQQLGQRLAALEAKPASPPADLGPIQQQLAALTKANGDLNANFAALQKTVRSQPEIDPRSVALALVLLQIREAIDLARPFAAEYRTLVALVGDRPEIAAAAQPLAAPAESGVASRAALAARLRQLAPAIATAKPPPAATWKSQVVARLRSLVTIRRTDGEAQTPAEAAVSTAERSMAAGDLSTAVTALAGLTGPAADAAAPWLRTARQRLAAETALRQIEAAVAAVLGTPAPGKG